MLKLAFKFSSGLLLFLLLFVKTTTLYCGNLDVLEHLIGDRDAVLVADPKGHIVFSKNVDIQLIPASTLKIFTALVAIHYLGSDYKFFTEFYMDRHSNLKIKGYGDPLLISETVAEMIHHLSMGLRGKYSIINDLILDDSYFGLPTVIPGVNVSYEPYDAPNGALCVNFNTVNFKRNKNGVYVSAESQTPLLPFILPRVKASQMDHGRIVLSSQKNEITRYAGQLFLYFLKKEGIRFNGSIGLGKVQKEADKLIYRYVSSFSLIQTLSKLLEYSNNFIANQLLITAGVKAYGPPGNLDKGIRAALIYAKNILEIDHVQIEEGSGISRKNRISARDFYKILNAFIPHYFLMRQADKMYFKTGTLKGIHTRAGYIKKKNGELYPFVMMINTPGKSPKPMMDIIQREFN
ncbi:MAG: D-alanyl-D-alanine carboxypeptidase [Desulfobacteraceae bacterium]|nr:D-alanyl-D-alanine carboxypeptidase [Desulfobacteraceae bacterium]MDH3722508.1 D-alanyl-D-alanine carboxypeptidase [Desulfobacteraceae bacterium]MDH3880918.1 D-alanyl-D-alanine carboxypeptidase [Desulfobacteraceae bacterium]